MEVTSHDASEKNLYEKLHRFFLMKLTIAKITLLY